jgi:hypothetical protein
MRQNSLEPVQKLNTSFCLRKIIIKIRNNKLSTGAELKMLQHGSITRNKEVADIPQTTIVIHLGDERTFENKNSARSCKLSKCNLRD